MPSINFDLLKHWFEQLADLSEADRLTFLREAQDIDEDTRNQLLQLLSADAQLTNHTARSAIKAARAQFSDDAMLGQRIGAYMIDKSLGRGGMGSVFLAHRADGSMEQRVAIKIVRPEVLDAHTLARFHLERQVLALLNHPHIATLLDAGALSDGSPYVVMEYIEGEAITTYANAQSLDVRSRLQLFLKVCDAVAFAHRNLIVHRDIKPGNVLVSEDGQPKLLDFGIAKPLIGVIGAVDVQDTAAAQRFFSPHNAAPEQLRNEPITPACDVYGLGVLLYELLTDAKPLDLHGLTPGEMEQKVLNEDAKAPSQRISIRAAHVSSCGSVIQSRDLTGDLDAIALKCLRKRPNDRYATVEALSADIRAHLDGFPVSARRGGRWYRARRFIGRHRVAVAATSALLVVGVFGALAWFGQYRATLDQQTRADQMTSLIMEALGANDPSQALGKDTTAREVFERVVVQLQANQTLSPSTRAAMMTPIAEIQRLLGDPDKALSVLDRVDWTLLDESSRHDYFVSKVRVFVDLGRFPEARAVLAEQRGVAQSSEAQIEWAFMRAIIEFQEGDANIAAKQFEELLAQPLPQELRDQARTALAECYRTTNRLDMAGAESEALFREHRRRFPGDHPRVLNSMMALTRAYADLGRIDEADKLAQELAAMAKRLYSEHSLRYLQAKGLLVLVARVRGQSDVALRLGTEILESQQQLLGKTHPSNARAHFNLALFNGELGHPKASEAHYRQAIDIAEHVWLPSHQNILLFRIAFASELAQQDRWAEAAEVAAAAIRNADSSPEFKQLDLHQLGALIVSIAAYQSQPSDKTRQAAFLALEEALAVAEGETRTVVNKVAVAARRLGLTPDRS